MTTTETEKTNWVYECRCCGVEGKKGNMVPVANAVVFICNDCMKKKETR